MFLTDVRIPDADRLGDGRRRLAGRADHADERAGRDRRRRAAARGRHDRRGRRRPGASGPSCAPPACTTRLLRLWVEAEVARLTGERLRQQLAAGAARPRGLGDEARLRPAQPGDHRPRGGTARRGGAAVRRLDDAPTGRASTSSAATPATATCAPRATRSRAAPRRSCATSSPSGCSACPPSRASTRTSPGRTCPMTTTADLLVLTDDRGRPARRRARPARRPAQPGRPTVLARVETATSPYDHALWRTLAAEMGLAGLLVPRGARRRRREPARGRRGRWRSSAARVAPVPFLTSAVVATAALLAAGTPACSAGCRRRGDRRAGRAAPAASSRRPRPPGRRRRCVTVPRPACGG